MKYTFLIILFLFVFTGCAMSPDEKESSGSQLIVEFRVKGKININERDDRGLLRNYFIAVNCDNSDGSYGPLPVVYKTSGAYGWGNGWGTSDKATQSKGITTFLRFNSENPSGNIFLIIPDSQLRQYSAPIVPSYCELTDDGRGIRAIFDYSLFETEEIPASMINKLQVNIITTNLIISNVTESTPGRRFDALGPEGNDYIDIIADKSYTYKGKDDEGDVADEDMDITDWTVQVVHQQNLL